MLEKDAECRAMARVDRQPSQRNRILARRRSEQEFRKTLRGRAVEVADGSTRASDPDRKSHDGAGASEFEHDRAPLDEQTAASLDVRKTLHSNDSGLKGRKCLMSESGQKQTSRRWSREVCIGFGADVDA